MKRTNTAVWLEKYNRWQIKVQKDGIRKTFTSSTPGRNGQRECNHKADEWLDDNITDSKLKVSEMTKRYMEQLILTTSRSHYRQYQGYFDNWINKKIGNVRIENISEHHLQSVINAAYAANLSKKTLSNIKACLLSFLKFCRACKATTLFVEGLYIPKGAQSKEKLILTPKDLKLLFSIETTLDHKKVVLEQYINAYRFQAITGLRPGEVLGLKWCDIEGNTVHLSRALNAYGEITKGKNDNARRLFCLTEFSNAILIDQKVLSKEQEIKSDFVFTNIYGEPIKQVNYYKHWKTYCTVNNITQTSPYELRHTFVSVVKTLPEGLLKAVIGHSKDMDSFGTYGHEIEGELQTTAQLIQDIFSKILKG